MIAAVASFLLMVGTTDLVRSLTKSRGHAQFVDGPIVALGLGILLTNVGVVSPEAALGAFIATVWWGTALLRKEPTLDRSLLAHFTGALALSVAAGLGFPSSEVSAWLLGLVADLSDAAVDPQEILLALGAVLFLTETSNILVRATLGPDLSSAVKRTGLSAGRVIGPLERYLVFGLALAGQFGAIGGVLAAKGVIRFPEISNDVRKGQQQSIAPEYFLIGTLASWGLALLAAAVLG